MKLTTVYHMHFFRGRSSLDGRGLPLHRLSRLVRDKKESDIKEILREDMKMDQNTIDKVLCPQV